LRAYLAGLAALFVIAAGAAVVYARVQSGADARDAAHADARFAARLAAAETGTGVKLLQQTVAGAAASPGIAAAFAHPGECALTFGGTDAYTTGHIDLLRPDGTVACSSRKGKGDYARASWLARAKTAPLLLAPVTDERTGKRVVLDTAPVKGLGIVLAVFDLDGLGKSLRATYGGPRGLDFTVRAGDTVLTRSGSDRRERINESAAVPNTDWRLTASADRARALASARRLNHRELVIILAGLALFLGAVALVHRRIARPLTRLRHELETPGPVTVGGPAEVAALGTRLNELGAAYHTLFDRSPLPTWVYDVHTRRILEANEAAAKTYGYQHDELVGLSVDALEREPGVHARKDGSTLQVSVASHAIAFRDHDACVVIAEDVTEKERLRLQLQQSQRLESLGRLAGGVAHDFNNLLAVILGYAAFIEARGGASESDAAEVRKAGERASRLTRQLLAFARREVPRPTVLDLTGVVLEMEQLLRRTLGRHVALETSLAPDLWPILADYGQLEQVLLNLAVNARDAMPDGGTMTLDTENVDVDAAYVGARPDLEPGRYVRLRVSDTGVGMDAATAARAFEPFFTTKPKGQGTGLGLATIHGIVTAAGGHVQIYSEPGLGTTFTILLPATDAPVPERPPAAETPAPGGGETILVVEDEPAMLAVTRRILETNGYEVLAAASGPEAIELARETPIDLLLTDVVMPQMLGKEVAERVSAVRPGVQVLFMSGYAQAVIAPMGDLAGGHEILDKPFTEAALLERLRAALASRATP
jgi:signal transduction histidine kinase/CheY-like chemotaxis protein